MGPISSLLAQLQGRATRWEHARLVARDRFLPLDAAEAFGRWLVLVRAVSDLRAGATVAGIADRCARTAEAMRRARHGYRDADDAPREREAFGAWTEARSLAAQLADLAEILEAEHAA